MRLIFLNRFYWPDESATAQLLTDLAEALAQKGHEVVVIASRTGPKAHSSREVRVGVTVQRTGGGWGRRSLPGRAVAFLAYLAGAAGRLLLEARRGDLVIAMTDPPMLGPALWGVVRLAGGNLLHWTQDIYPEVARAAHPGLSSRLAVALLMPLRNFAWRHSRGAVVLGTGMAAVLRRHGVEPGRISIISNWAPRGAERPAASAIAAVRSRWALEERFIVMYAGNLGRVHDLDPVLDVAAALQSDPGILFLFVGSGARRRSLERTAAHRRLENVRFLPAQPRGQLGALLAAADLHLVTLLPGAEDLVFPSKLYGILAAECPVAYIGPAESEIAGLVRRHGLGLAGTRDQAPALAEGIRNLRADPERLAACARAAAAFGRTSGRLEHAVALWEERIGREAACDASPAPAASTAQP